MVSPALEQVATELAGRIKLVKVNVDNSPQLQQRFNVMAIPTLMMLRRGQVAERRAGAVPTASLCAWVEEVLGN
jgi:thioredoxin 2